MSVTERIQWYEKRTHRHRIAFFSLETLIIVSSAAIPAAAAAGASVATVGILGAVVTALAGLRQLLRLNENWIRFSTTLVALHREVVAWSLAAPPYDQAGPDARLATQVEALVAEELGRWTELRRAPAQPLPSLPGDSPGAAASTPPGQPPSTTGHA